MCQNAKFGTFLAFYDAGSFRGLSFNLSSSTLQNIFKTIIENANFAKMANAQILRHFWHSLMLADRAAIPIILSSKFINFAKLKFGKEKCTNMSNLAHF